jgi:hypothetical protein
VADPSLSFEPARNSVQWTSEPLYAAARPAPSAEEIDKAIRDFDVGGGEVRIPDLIAAVRGENSLNNANDIVERLAGVIFSIIGEERK